jgi:hypothetical protein
VVRRRAAATLLLLLLLQLLLPALRVLLLLLTCRPRQPLQPPCKPRKALWRLLLLHTRPTPDTWPNRRRRRLRQHPCCCHTWHTPASHATWPHHTHAATHALHTWHAAATCHGARPHSHPATKTLLHHHTLLQVRRHPLHAPASTPACAHTASHNAHTS